MASYATAVETISGPVDTTNLRGGSREQRGGVHTKHAVEWPDPLNRNWERVTTLCGKSTGEYGIWKAPPDPVAEWPPQDDQKDICPKCRTAAEQSS